MSRVLIHVGPAPRIAVELVESVESVDSVESADSTGAARRPFVLFLHGIGGGRGQWRPQLEGLADSYRVAAWDARGYGDSDDYAGPLDFAVFTTDVLRVLDHLGIDRAHLVGLSMGGRIAREVALRAPERVARLVLANTSPGFGALTAAAQRAFVEARAAPLRAGVTPAELARSLAPRLLHPEAEPAALAAAIAMMSALHPESYIKTVEASVAQDRAAPIERITAPTLIITSDADPLYPQSVARDMAARIPQAQLAIIERAGHLTNLERPAAFNAVLRAFLPAA